MFEVLSPSTQAYDFDEEFGHYRTIATLQQYVLVHQDRAEVIVYVRQNDEAWTFRAYSGLFATVPLLLVSPAAIGLPLADIYDNLTFLPEPPASGSGDKRRGLNGRVRQADEPVKRRKVSQG